MADGEAGGEGVRVDVTIGAAGDGKMVAGEDIAVTRSNTSSVEDERNGSRSIAWGLGVRIGRWLTPRSGSLGMMKRSVNSGAWLGLARKCECGTSGVR